MAENNYSSSQSGVAQPSYQPPQNTNSNTFGNIGNKSSNKSVFLIVLIIGVFLVGSIGYIAYNYLNSLNESQNILTNIPSTVNAPTALFLSLESPSDDTLVVNDSVVVKGKTLPNTTVGFYTDTQENSVESDAGGNFEGTIPLSSGINTLTVTAYGQNADEKTIIVDVVYDEDA